MDFFGIFRRRASSGPPEKQRSSDSPVPPSDQVTVPKGHEVTIYRAQPLPGVYFSNGGVCIASQGTPSDEPTAEIDYLLQDVRDKTLGRHCQILLAKDAPRASDLFAPADPAVIQTDGLQLWALSPAVFVSSDAGPAILQLLLREIYLDSVRGVPQVVYVPDLASPEGFLLAELVSGLGITVYEYDSVTGAILLEVRRPEDAVISALPGRPFNLEGPASQYIHQINELKDAAEKQSDSGRLRQLEEQEREYLANRLTEAQGKTTKAVTRAPHLCRLLLAVQDGEEGAWQTLCRELLQREIPLLVIVDPETRGATQRTWPGRGTAMPVYPDGDSLTQTVNDLGIPMGSLGIAEMTPHDIFSWMEKQNSAVAINVFRDEKTPLYVWFQAEIIKALSEGKIPTGQFSL